MREWQGTIHHVTVVDDGFLWNGQTHRSIRARKIDVVVVYKVDRLTRSLADFAKLVELFEADGECDKPPTIVGTRSRRCSFPAA